MNENANPAPTTQTIAVDMLVLDSEAGEWVPIKAVRTLATKPAQATLVNGDVIPREYRVIDGVDHYWTGVVWAPVRAKMKPCSFHTSCYGDRAECDGDIGSDMAPK